MIILYKNDLYVSLISVILVLLIIIDILGLSISINDIFYLKDILADKEIEASRNTFFIQKNLIEYWVSFIGHIIYVVSFLIWFYRAYKNVYIKTLVTAPCRPIIVPFSYLIPIFNFFGPYQIMKFIWIQNNQILFPEGKKNEYRIIKFWWFMSLLTLIYSRVCAGKFKYAEYADEYLTATYLHIFLYITSIHFSLISIRVIRQINNFEKLRKNM